MIRVLRYLLSKVFASTPEKLGALTGPIFTPAAFQFDPLNSNSAYFMDVASGHPIQPQSTRTTVGKTPQPGD